MKERIWVLGAGAVGTALGGMIRTGGFDVGFIPKKSPTNVHERTSVRVTLPNRRIMAEGIELVIPKNLPASKRPDFLLVCLGRQHLRAVNKETLKGLVDPERTHMVFCNADPNEALGLEMPSACRSRAAALLNAVKLQDGDVEVTAARPHLIMDRGPASEALGGCLESLGVTVRSVVDASPYLNSLFVYELLYLPAALCNSTMAYFLSFPAGRRIARTIISEGMKTMEKSGRQLAKLPMGDPRELADRLNRAQEFEALRFSPDRAYSPVLQSYLRGTAGEARELNKRIVEMGASVGLELPMNWRIYQKAGRPSNVGYYRDPAELEKALA